MKRTSVILLIAAIAAGGCSRQGIQKTELTGEVTYNGEPIELGMIHFKPKQGTAGPMAAGSIIDGKYAVNASGGVPLGEHTVEILGYVELPKPPNSPPIAPTPRDQYVPAKYNTQTELECTIKSSSDAVRDFELEGPPRKHKPLAKAETAK